MKHAGRHARGGRRIGLQTKEGLVERHAKNVATLKQKQLRASGYRDAVVQPIIVSNKFEGCVVYWDGDGINRSVSSRRACRNIPKKRIYCDHCNMWDIKSHPPHHP